LLKTGAASQLAFKPKTMKKIQIALLLCLFSTAALQAQKAFRGTMTFTYEISEEGAEQMKAFMPEGMVVKYGDNKMATEMKGGMLSAMMGRIIVNAGEAYVVKDSDQAVYVMDEEDKEGAKEAVENQPKATKVDGETKEILGYTCQKYLFTMKQDGQQIEQVVWATDAFKAPDMKLPSQQGSMGSGMLSMGGIDAMPLQVDIAMPNMPVTIVLKATEMVEGEVPDEAFAKPDGYEEKPFSEMMK
jgi:hypothetical protein